MKVRWNAKVSTKSTRQVFRDYWILVTLWSLPPFLALTCMYYQKMLATWNYCLVIMISSFNVLWDYKNEINYYSLSLPALKTIVYISCWSNHYSSFGLVGPPAPLSALSPSSTNSSGKRWEAVKVSRGGAVPPNSAGRNCGSMSVCTWVKSEPWTCN